MKNKAEEYQQTSVEVAGEAAGGLPVRSFKTFDSFRISAFRIYYGAMAGQWISMSMQLVVRSLLIYRITGSGAILGAMSLANAIPMLITSLLGGVMADRMPKKKVLFIGQTSSGLVSLGVALTLTLGYLGPAKPDSWWILIVSAMLQGIIMGFMMPSRQAIIPEVVGEKQVMNAISLNNMGMNLFRLIAPALAGFIIDNYGFYAVYYIMTGTYFASTVFAALLPRATRAVTTHTSSTFSDIVEGMRYIRSNKTILLILTFTTVSIICGMPFMRLLPMFTEDILKVNATGMGLLVSLSGVGAILGSLVLASLPSRGRGKMMMLGSLVLGLALITFSSSHWWYPSLLFMVFIGLGQTAMMALGNTLAQSYVDIEYRGRVMSFFMMGMGFASFGAFFGGIISEAVGVQWAVGGLAAILVLLTVTMFIASPRLRGLD